MLQTGKIEALSRTGFVESPTARYTTTIKKTTNEGNASMADNQTPSNLVAWSLIIRH